MPEAGDGVRGREGVGVVVVVGVELGWLSVLTGDTLAVRDLVRVRVRVLDPLDAVSVAYQEGTRVGVLVLDRVAVVSNDPVTLRDRLRDRVAVYGAVREGLGVGAVTEQESLHRGVGLSVTLSVKVWCLLKLGDPE